MVRLHVNETWELGRARKAWDLVTGPLGLAEHPLPVLLGCSPPGAIPFLLLPPSEEGE